MVDISDEELLKQMMEKDQHAFLILYNRYARRVFALTLHILQNERLAEEATQDAFLKCWNRAHSFFNERGAFSTWLLTIARNTALDTLRLDKHRPSMYDDKDPEEVWDLLPDAASQSEETRWRSLHFILQSLPKDNRIAIEMAYYQSLSHSEIADILGWPVGTVKTRIRLGMDQLREQWLKEEIPDL